MTPQEIFEYKNRWKPGHTVQLHSDIVDRGKSWCKRHLEQLTRDKENKGRL